MESDQNNQNQGVPAAPLPSSAPDNHTPSTPSSKPPTWLWFVIGGVVLLGLVVGGFLIPSLFKGGQGPLGGGSKGQITDLTVNGKPLVYPCSVATAADYGRIFGYDGSKVGTVTETSPLAAKDIKTSESDLTKLAEPNSDSYDMSCSYALGNSGGTTVKMIRIRMQQYVSEEKAQKGYTSARNGDSQDYTNDGVDNGKRKLNPLPSFANNSYVRVPDPGDSSTSVEGTFLLGTQVFTFDFLFDPPQTADQVVTMFDEYAKAIQTNLNKNEKTAPIDLTGHETMANKKFVDICRRTDFSKLTAAIGDIELRPDQQSVVNTYGSLPGSRAAQDGVLTNCELSFNTPGDRQAINALFEAKANSQSRSTTTLSARAEWPHKLTLVVNSFSTPEAARAMAAAKKQRVSAPVLNSRPVVKDVTGIGDSAFSLHTERSLSTLLNGQPTDVITAEDSYIIVDGGDVITVNLTQESSSKNFKTAPLEIKEDYFKKAYTLVKETLAANR